MIKYCDLFWSFFKIGTFTVGGGYAMLPLMQREVVERRRWMDDGDFLDSVALAQSMPGVFAVNVAALTGFRLRGIGGAAAAIVGNVLMPIVFILLLAIFFRALRNNALVEHIFAALRPAVVALVAVPAVRLWLVEYRKRKEGKGGSLVAVVAVPLVVAAAVWLLGVNPIVVVLLAVAVALLVPYMTAIS